MLIENNLVPSRCFLQEYFWELYREKEGRKPYENQD